MPGNSIFAGSSGNGGSSAHDSDGGGPSKMMGIGDDDVKNLNGSGGDLFESDRSTAGNRWPRQETLALLKIRSDMDVTFRDSSLKGPLWEEVSRKMGELGYHRTAKKCKEKFENVYKYHKRTKDGRVGKSEGKTYKFFDQLKALEQPHHHHHHQSSSSLPSQLPRCQSEAPPEEAVPVTMIIPAGTIPVVNVTVPSNPQPVPVGHTTSITAPPQQNNVNPTNPTIDQTHKMDHPNVIPNHMSSIQMEDDPSATQSSSSSWSSSDGEEMVGPGRKRKRKWKDFFERLMKEVIDKQEELQKRFLEAVEKQEHDRMAREEAWKMQEKARLNREHDILAQERSMAAAKDAALMAFLQKLSHQQQIPLPLPFATTTTAATTTPQLQQSQSQLQPQPQQHIIINNNNVVENSMASPSSQKPPHQMVVVEESNVDNFPQPSSSRWPKDEIQALINLRTSLDQKYQDNGPKGPLWEEISGLMKQMGYNRNAKRCKEKWENINKYFKRVKESNKKRPEDSKTCPYFHQLDALYRMKNKMEIISPSNSLQVNNKAPIMGQQWPPTHMGDEGSEEQDDSGDDAHQHNHDHHHGGSGYQIIINPNDNDHQMRT